jgi:16S rRNA A1518/A1519 N6-dimethyltransferase RsmA/KsgA/DIM1 with predicted DNA glycosylase/AP lyase activity
MARSVELHRKMSNQPPAILQEITRDRLYWVGKIPPGAEHPLMPSRETYDQNFLVSGRLMKRIIGKIDPRSLVIEVGSGVGVLTEALAERNLENGGQPQVLGIELDKAFHPIYSSINNHLPQIGFAMGDALHALDLTRIRDEQQIQIVSNLPFSIAKEFTAKLAGTRIHNAILFLGKDNARQVKEHNPESPHYGHMSLITQTFFETETVARVGRGYFYPMADTTGEVVIMTPLSPDKMGIDTPTHIFSQIIRDTQPVAPDPDEQPVVFQHFEPPSIATSISRALDQDQAFFERILTLARQTP